jgi:hypothetical protein
MVQNNRTGTLIVTALFSLLMTGCTPEVSGKPPNPPPIDRAPQPIPGDREGTFVLRAFDTKGRPAVRFINVTLTGLQSDGKIAKYIDQNGNVRQGPQVAVYRAPWNHEVTLSSGVVSISMTAVMPGEIGERVHCHVEIKGLQVRGSEDDYIIKGVPGAGNKGAGAVTCIIS